MHFVCNILLSNLSTDTAYKAFKQHVGKKDKETENNIKIQQKLWTITDIIKSLELMVLLMVECFSSFQLQFELLINMISIHILKLSMIKLAVTMAISYTLIVICLTLIEKKLLNDVVNIYFLYVCSLVAVIVSSSLLLLTVSLNLRDTFWQIF